MDARALPYRTLIELTAISPDVSADLRRLDTLVRYAYDHDTAGLVPYEVATALVHDLGALDRLHAVDLLHHHFDVSFCGCGAPKSAWHWSIHNFRALVESYRRAHVVVAL
jgi:hypothetical protein